MPFLFTLNTTMLAYHIVTAVAALSTSTGNWTVLPNTDYKHNGGGPLSPAIIGTSAEDCANACLKLANCVAVVWNAPPGMLTLF